MQKVYLIDYSVLTSNKQNLLCLENVNKFDGTTPVNYLKLYKFQYLKSKYGTIININTNGTLQC